MTANEPLSLFLIIMPISNVRTARSRSRRRSAGPRSRSRPARRGRSLVGTVARSGSVALARRSRVASIGRAFIHPAARAAARFIGSHRRIAQENRADHAEAHGVFKIVKDVLRPAGAASKLGKKKAAGFYKYFDEYYLTINSDEGKQFTGTIGAGAVWSDLCQKNFPAGNFQPGNANFWTKQCMLDLNPMQKTTGGNYYTAGQTPANQAFILDKINLHLDLCNLATTAAIMDVWICVPKHTMRQNPTQTWADGLVQEAIAPDNADATQAGSVLGVYTAPTEGKCNMYMLNQSPHSVPLFKQMWTVIKHRTFEFSADTNIQWHIDFEYQKVIDLVKKQEEYIQTASDTGTRFKHMSFDIMYRLRGQVIVDNQLTGSKNCTIGAAEIGVVATREYTCRGLTTPQTIRTETAVPYLLAGGGLANQFFNNIVDTAAQLTELM